MTVQRSLEVKGTLADYPLAELIVEIRQSQLSGSLRIGQDARKTVFYFSEGEVVYGVSNAREHRLFTLMMEKRKMPKETVVKYPNFANDVEFAAALVRDGQVTEDAMASAVIDQIEAVMIDCLTWNEGDWVFSPLARLRSDMSHKIDVHRTLMNYARYQPLTKIHQRFRSIEEKFSHERELAVDENLLPHEVYVYNCFREGAMKIEELRARKDMPEQGFLQGLYVLWLGGLLYRQDWNAAFSPAKIREILSADLTLVKNAANVAEPDQVSDKAEEEVTEKPVAETTRVPVLEITLDEWLKRVAAAETHYDLLGVDEKADVRDIKNAYFGLAKLFHPDRYHKEKAETLRRIQTGFTNLAHAYETLKTSDSRQSYDFKVKKELEAKRKRQAAANGEVVEEMDAKAVSGREAFEQGLEALGNDDYEAAAMLLSRAVHYSPQSATYHAYYGHALSADDRMRHKADSEFQAAVKLDPESWKIRSMLVEFLVDMNMTKRAVGELKRYLDLKPGNAEAAAWLKRLEG